MSGMGKANPRCERALLRVLRFLASGAVHVEAGDATGNTGVPDDAVVLERSDRSRLKVSTGKLQHLCRDDLIARCGQSLVLTASGKARLKRSLACVDGFQQQHQDRAQVELAGAKGKTIVVQNREESPLSRLRYRGANNGTAYISDEEFRAGERLRADFTRAQLMQSTTTNWDSMVHVDVGSAGSNGMETLTDTALDFRMRLERALACVGPELSGPLLDVCCFLKGLETVERERRWPNRSAKLMVRTGLAILARHYGLSAQPASANGDSARIRHWGEAGYRPHIAG